MPGKVGTELKAREALVEVSLRTRGRTWLRRPYWSTGQEGLAALLRRCPAPGAERMIAAGVLAPYPVPMRPTPPDAPMIVHHLCAGFKHLLECKWHHCPNTATQFSQSFAARWCGIPKGSVSYALQLAQRLDLIVYAGQEYGAPVYRPGKDEQEERSSDDEQSHSLRHRRPAQSGVRR